MAQKVSFSKSTWALLHKAETRPYTFNPMSSNWSKIEFIRNRMDNPVWKEVYGSLLACRKNLIKASPPEFFTLPVNGEPYITKNNITIQQPWCKYLTIYDILGTDGNFKTIDDYPPGKRPVFLQKHCH